jgi:Na+/melibiose symporter-like transporter
MAKNLRTLTSKFPSFGVLFETIDAAKGDLMYFTIISGVMVISFTMICYCLFGCNEEQYSTVRMAIISILKMTFGKDMLLQIYGSNSKGALTFFVIFSIFIYFVILNVYAAIVMRTYDNLR